MYGLKRNFLGTGFQHSPLTISAGNYHQLSSFFYTNGAKMKLKTNSVACVKEVYKIALIAFRIGMTIDLLYSLVPVGSSYRSPIN